jgi:hypothetical protein
MRRKQKIRASATEISHLRNLARQEIVRRALNNLKAGREPSVSANYLHRLSEREQKNIIATVHQCSASDIQKVLRGAEEIKRNSGNPEKQSRVARYLVPAAKTVLQCVAMEFVKYSASRPVREIYAAAMLILGWGDSAR